jgi:hypothetical protein
LTSNSKYLGPPKVMPLRPSTADEGMNQQRQSLTTANR